jgi:hypothetical protein
LVEQKLKREMNVWSALEHTNIVKFYGHASVFEGNHALISEVSSNTESSALKTSIGDYKLLTASGLVVCEWARGPIS